MKATAFKEQFLTDAGGKRVGVLLDLSTYERFREAEEELADIEAYDVARPKVLAEVAAGRTSTLAEYRAEPGAEAAMRYTVIIPHSVQKQLDRLPGEVLNRILRRLAALETEPRPPDVQKLKGREAWRIRVGDYRVIYEIHDRLLEILIVKAGHRREVYR